jgi:hypothetical protein
MHEIIMNAVKELINAKKKLTKHAAQEKEKQNKRRRNNP